ncbi:MAG: zinc-finger domain-containing protein [Rhodospirillaceae bacterium]|nr:zinc-finger domain-containing protein [Rhodospirillaceae bacterium]
MPKPTEIIDTNKHTIACQGGNGPLGHPRVFLTIGHEGEVLCPYCSRLYRYRTSAIGDAAD